MTPRKVKTLNLMPFFPKHQIFQTSFIDSFAEFQKLAVTAGSPLNHFNVPWDAAKIGWAQSINTLDSLKSATEGKTSH